MMSKRHALRRNWFHAERSVDRALLIWQRGDYAMGCRQTQIHRFGKFSYHQVGLVRGQYGNVPEGEWIAFLQGQDFDGWEEAGWELDLGRCGSSEGAAAYAKERVALAKKHELEIFTLAMHLQGQALGDEPSAKTLQFVGGKAVEAYKSWRATGGKPPLEDPYYVPAEVGRLIHSQARQSLINAARYAHFLGKEQDRQVPISGFVGSPANCWSHFFGFPPTPTDIGGYKIPDVREVSLALLVERFGPVFQTCQDYKVKFGLECHPSERAMGDIESALDFKAAMEKAGFGDTVGFNFDPSHLVWQGVDPVEFIRVHGESIYSVHVKGVQVIPWSRAGLLGGHRPMGHPLNGWNFVTPGSRRDSVDVEAMIVELNRIGYDGAISIEWEDNDAEQYAGAAAALKNVHASDLPPSGMRHDEALKAKR
ncbi:MAG: sugar phosphate isomerase/epimerase [Candidatus Peribacteraceae bacterium]